MNHSYYLRNRTKIIERVKKYHRLHREERLKKMKEHYYSHKSEYIDRVNKNPRRLLHKKKYYKKHKEEILKKMSERKFTRRQALLEKLGGRCSTCGENNYRYLHIDRIKGGEHPRNFEWIVNNLNQFQILCANHHNEKTVYKFIIWPPKQ